MMSKGWKRSVVRVFALAALLGIIVPFGSAIGWTEISTAVDRQARRSPEWPCDPWGSRPLREVAYALYRIYYWGSTPSRLVTLRKFPELRAVDRDRWSPAVVATTRDFAWDWPEWSRRGEVIQWLWWVGITFLAWLAVLGLIEILWRCCFSKAWHALSCPTQ